MRIFKFQLDIIVPPIKKQEEYAALAKQYLINKEKASKKIQLLQTKKKEAIQAAFQ